MNLALFDFDGTPTSRDTVAVVSAGLDVYLSPWCEVPRERTGRQVTPIKGPTRVMAIGVGVLGLFEP